MKAIEKDLSNIRKAILVHEKVSGSKPVKIIIGSEVRKRIGNIVMLDGIHIIDGEISNGEAYPTFI